MLLIGFLAGLVVATIVGVALLGMRVTTVGDAEEVLQTPTPTTTGSATESPTGPGPDASGGDVPDPCVRSAEYNLAIDESLDQLAVGARDEDARTIQEALDAIQGARADAEGSAQECLDLANGTGTQ